MAKRRMPYDKGALHPVVVRIGEALDETGMTIEELGNMADVAPSTISGWFQSGVNPTLHVVDKVLEALGMHLVVAESKHG